ncbi:hypothetical protein MNL13_07425 [Bartonella krasnovii]|uniref:TrwJ3 protein n=1 Tax=Bartonella krasnovii TaxID=2267275 RepID=A0ABY3W1F5_9HYPH|nr:type IV secretion system protein [Bartonella krasnovii]UNF29018.1 hypothetical protein MNL13_07425 [Bartonella krasnovii]UNF35373.1 hypothetical protein MNL12_07340 [Bartonella krasnovii]UNF48555.1 hypothetical protein MNL04_07655 [Bartonella krasnovii]
MKKRFIITGVITILAMLNLTLTTNFSWSSNPQDSTVQTLSSFSKEEYLKIIELLTQQIKTTEEKIEKTKKIHQSITGNRIQKPTIGKDKDFFLQDSPSLYPEAYIDYAAVDANTFKHFKYFESLIGNVRNEEQRYTFWYSTLKKMHEIINRRLQYSGIVEKAVSLQTFQDAEKRFTQITDFLNEIDKTKDLREVFELQTRIRNMSAMLQNEYTKLQMVRNLSDNEEVLIEIQKRKLYGKIMNYTINSMPKIKF